MKRIKDIYYYFGRNDRHDYIATPIGNVLLSGKTVAIKSVVLDSIIVRMIQERNPSDIDIHVSGLGTSGLNVWKNMPEGKVIPQIKSVNMYSSVSNDKAFGEFFRVLRDAYDEAMLRSIACSENNLESYKMLGGSRAKAVLYIMDEYQTFANRDKDSFNNLVSKIVSSSYVSGVYLMLSSGCNMDALAKDTVSKFDIGACIPCVDDLESNAIIGNDLASRDKDPYGALWVRNRNEAPVRMCVPFYPDTWIKKFIWCYSVRKGS